MRLYPRQVQILDLIRQGMGQRRCAMALNISTLTAWGHFRALKRKGAIETTEVSGSKYQTRILEAAVATAQIVIPQRATL